MTDTTHLTTAERKPGWEHIPVYPRGFIAIRIAQLVLAFLVLGLSAFGIWGLAISGTCLTLFVAIATLITTVWLLVAHFAKPKIYNYWAVLALDIFLVVFWLVAFAVLASQVSTLYSLVGLSRSSYYYDYSYYYSSSSLESALFTAWLACQAAAAALGGVLFVLFVITLVFHSMALHRHRAAGRHSKAGSAATPGAESSAPELAPYNDKTNPVQSYPAPVYTQTQPAAAYPPQQQQQFYDPSTAASPLSATQAQQGYYAPPPQQQQYVDGQHQPQYHQQQQQPVYPQQPSSPPPLSAQYTGSSMAQAQQQPPPPQNNAVEVPAQAYQQH